MTFFPLITIIMQALVYVVVIAWERVGLQISSRVQIGLLPASRAKQNNLLTNREKRLRNIPQLTKTTTINEEN